MNIKKGDRKSYSCISVYQHSMEDSWKPGRLIKIWIRLLMGAASLQRKSIIQAIRDSQVYIYSIDYRKQQLMQ